MVSEHEHLGFAPELLGDTFGLAYFGNGMVAIAAGVVAEVRLLSEAHLHVNSSAHNL